MRIKATNRIFNLLLITAMLFSWQASTGVSAAAVSAPAALAPAALAPAALSPAPVQPALTGVEKLLAPAAAGPTNPPLLLKDINSATNSSNPLGKFTLTVNGSLTLLFFADDGIHGNELWKTDGTTGNTTLVKDILPGQAGISTYGVKILGNKAYFIPNIYTSNWTNKDVALWVTDGTEAGTHVETAILPSGEAAYQSAFIIGISGTKVYMSVDDTVHGMEPWVYDLAVPATAPTLLIDVITGGMGTDFYGSNTLGSTFYFWAWDGDENAWPYNYNLWKSQGTTATTALVKDASDNPIICNFYKSMALVVLGSYLYFNNDLSGTISLWRTDGTTVSQFYASPAFNNLLTFNGKIYFDGNDGTHGLELMASDGATTYLVKDINPSGASQPYYVTPVGSKLFFFAYTPAAGNELYVSDGSEGNATLVKDIISGSNSPDGYDATLIDFNGKLVFFVDDKIHGKEPWISDGTEAGTHIVADIYPGKYGSSPQQAFTFGDNFYLMASDYNGGNLYGSTWTETNTELWKSDGTEAGTALVKDINQLGYGSGLYPQFFTLFNGKMYFNAQDAANGPKLWMSDGTAAGTSLIPGDTSTWAIESGYNQPSPVVFNGYLYYAGQDSTHGIEIWRTDGTKTELFTDLNTYNLGGGVTNGSYPGNFTVMGSYLYFTGSDAAHSQQLWRTDGTTVTMVTNMNTAGYGCACNSLTVLNGYLYFSGYDGLAAKHGQEVWRTDGVNAPELFDIYPGTWFADWIPADVGYSSEPTAFTVMGSYLYFVATTAAGKELVRTNGTGFEMVADINTAGDGISPYPALKVMNDVLYFVADDGTHGFELWRSDGTAAGTSLVKDINPNGNGIRPYSAMPSAVLNGYLYFVATDASSGGNNFEVWRSDGTAAGTGLVKDLTPGSGSYPRNLTAFAGKIYFNAYVENTELSLTIGSELFYTDGTAAGTGLVYDLWPGIDASGYSNGSNPSQLTPWGNYLYFQAATAVAGKEIYTYQPGPIITFTPGFALYPGDNFTAAAATDSGGAITYSKVSGPCTQVGSTAVFTPTGVGDCVVMASVAANGVYAAGSDTYTYPIKAGGWNALGGGAAAASDTIRAVISLGGNLYAGGHFSTIGACSTCNNIAMWDGSAWQPLGSGLSGSFEAGPSVSALAVGPDGNLYVGGDFTSAGACTDCKGIARWNVTTGVWSALNTGMDAAVYSIAFHPITGNLYVGGNFTTAGACTSGCLHIAMWDGGIWSQLDGGTDYYHGGNVFALAFAPDGRLFVGGAFTSVGSSPLAVYRIAMWNSFTGQWSALGGGVNDISNTSVVKTLAFHNGVLYAGGSFDGMVGVAGTAILASWNGTAWSPVGGLSGFHGDIRSLGFTPGGSLIVGGSFHSNDSCAISCGRLAMWNGSQWGPVGGGVSATPPNSSDPTSSVNSLVVTPDGLVFSGGNFGTVGTGSANRIALLVPVTLKASTTGLSLSPADSAAYGAEVTLTATLTSGSTGTVTFQRDGSDIVDCTAVAVVSNSAVCKTSSLDSGTSDYTANYSGDTAYEASSSSAVSYTIGAASVATTTSLVITPDQSAVLYVSQIATFTVTVAPTSGTSTPTGTVKILQGAVELCSITLASGAGSCTYTFTTNGLKTLHAAYAGDTGFDASDSANQDITVRTRLIFPYILFN